MTPAPTQTAQLGRGNTHWSLPLVHIKAHFKFKYSHMNIISRDVGENIADTIYEYTTTQSIQWASTKFNTMGQVLEHTDICSILPIPLRKYTV